MEREKGFTLVELLAVVIIISFIALLVTPIVTKVINNAKKDSFKTAAYGLKKAAQMKFMDLEAEEYIENIIFHYNDGGETSNIEGVYLEYEGEKPKSGYIIVNETGDVALAIHNGKYCAQKSYYQSTITVSTRSADQCDIPFECGQLLVDVRDGQEYKTVQIENQCWMAENLRYVGEGENSCLTSGSYESCNLAEWNDGTYSSCCVHNSDTPSESEGPFRDWDEMQVLYQWGAAVDFNSYINSGRELPYDEDELEAIFEGAQGMCPKGWVVPTNDDWRVVVLSIDSDPDREEEREVSGWYYWCRGATTGKMLKSKQYWNGDDNFGFNGLPTGYSINNYELYDIGNYTSYWTSTLHETTTGWWFGLSNSSDCIDYGYEGLKNGNSIRCIKR